MSRLYAEPKALKVLTQIDKELQEQNSSLEEYMGLILSFNNDEDRYDCTPDDAIILGRTGVDGDHFAFLTKSGAVDDLEDAPIVFIQPMDFGNEVKLVARNLNDLLSLFIELKELYILERFDIYKNELDFINDYDENYKEELQARSDDHKFIVEKLQKGLELSEIKNVYNYIKELRS
ncbi:hypothetical protein [Cohnella sp. AR92]|uniref:hypothetical protein n=1 Tax=Cohnella sp. AR92 TaxID=648716 RepID=UPI000F8C4610|nr:hypothetical protein [Cohnella sp. AR92]RUS47935.1 hypothetical protein ELR57_05205 [Cohnella sp. AR92]